MMARRCHGDVKKLKIKNWETAKDRRTWRDLAEKAKTHKGLYCQMMMMIVLEHHAMKAYSRHTCTSLSFVVLQLQIQEIKCTCCILVTITT
jgi:hypothetical protein